MAARSGMSSNPADSQIRDEAAVAKRADSQGSPVSRYRMRKAAAKTSPAPVGSMAVAGKASM